MLFDNDCVTEAGNNFICKFETEVFVGKFSPAEENRDFNFVADLQEFVDLTELDTHIVVADFQAQAHLLYIKRLGAAPVFLLLLGALVVVLAPVDNLGHGRVRVRRNLYKVEILLLGNAQGFRPRQNAQLFAIFVNYPKLWCLNGCIQAGKLADKLLSLHLFMD